jgi:hypothetical protein
LIQADGHTSYRRWRILVPSSRASAVLGEFSGNGLALKCKRQSPYSTKLLQADLKSLPAWRREERRRGDGEAELVVGGCLPAACCSSLSWRSGACRSSKSAIVLELKVEEGIQRHKKSRRGLWNLFSGESKGGSRRDIL